MDDIQKPPEMFSVALSKGNKVTIGFRLVPVTSEDWSRIKSFLDLLEASLVNNELAGEHLKPPEPLEVPTASAGRVLRGHVATEIDLARASERIALRDNIKWAQTAMEEARIQSLRERKASTQSSNESDDNSQS